MNLRAGRRIWALCLGDALMLTSINTQILLASDVKLQDSGSVFGDDHSDVMKHAPAHDAIHLQTLLLELLDQHAGLCAGLAGVLDAERVTCISGYLACQEKSGEPYLYIMQTLVHHIFLFSVPKSRDQMLMHNSCRDE